MQRQLAVRIQGQPIVAYRSQQIRQQNILQSTPVETSNQAAGNRTAVIIIEKHEAAEKNKRWRTEFKKDVDPIQPVIIRRS
ncbi:hypothetical protein D3C75_1141300 [compost metagenome]